MVDLEAVVVFPDPFGPVARGRGFAGMASEQLTSYSKKVLVTTCSVT